MGTYPIFLSKLFARKVSNMIKKEFKGAIRNPAYYIVMLLPILLTFIMSEGTKGYLSQGLQDQAIIRTTREISLYNGLILGSKEQFAVSELNFMLLIYSILPGLSIFEERRLHIWDRLVKKSQLLIVKFIVYYILSLIMIAINVLVFKFCFNISFPSRSICIFCSLPIVSVFLGLFIGVLVNNRTMLSNTLLMLVMIMGYFGGALSLTSVLANTKFMNVLMKLSPLSMVNRLIFKDLISMNWGNDLWVWSSLLLIISILLIGLISRRVKNGASI